MIEFIDDELSCDTIKMEDMGVGQTGIAYPKQGVSFPIMKIYSDSRNLWVQLDDGQATYSGEPQFKVRLCDFELREKKL